LHAPGVHKILEATAAETQQILKLNIPIEAKASIGLNWLETH